MESCRQPHRRLVPLVLLVPFVLLVGGCDGSSTDPLADEVAEYELTVSGDLNFTTEGQATHSAQPLIENVGFAQSVNLLADGASVRQFQLVRRSSGNTYDPGPGTLASIDSSWTPDSPEAEVGLWAVRARFELEGGGSIQLLSTEGTVELSGVQSGVVPGQVSATLQGTRTVGGETETITVQIQATFNALPAFALG